MSNDRRALVVGASGIAGSALMEHLGSSGWEVFGTARGEVAVPDGATLVKADLEDPTSLEALRRLRPTHVYFTAWKRHATEAENIAGNGAMVRYLVEAVGESAEHVALLTGLKHYIGSPDQQGRIAIPDTPFLEESARRDVPNFYYAQEDELFKGAERHGYTWSVHRAHTIVGASVGGAMNMGLTLAAYAAICREMRIPFAWPGSEIRWNGLGDMSSADLIADHMVWASQTPAVANKALNIVNGDVFRWRVMWPRLAEMLGVEAVGWTGERLYLTELMAEAAPVWEKIALRYGLVEPDIRRVASWWHTDGDLGRSNEMLADMRRSREAGYHGYRTTEHSFGALFGRYERMKVIPPVR